MLLSTMKAHPSNDQTQNGTEIKTALITGAKLKSSYCIVTVQTFYCSREPFKLLFDLNIFLFKFYYLLSFI